MCVYICVCVLCVGIYVYIYIYYIIYIYIYTHMFIYSCIQVADDILDVTASTEELGKTAGKDLDADKTTYPKLLGLDRSREVYIYLCCIGTEG